MFATHALRPRTSHPLSVQYIQTSKPLRHHALVCSATRLILQPEGDMSTDHIQGNAAELPPVTAIELTEGLFDLGRVEPADLVIPIPTISARHCTVKVEESGAVLITDLASTNGTKIDGVPLEPLEPTPLPLGSEVIFGDKHLAAFRLTAVEDKD